MKRLMSIFFSKYVASFLLKPLLNLHTLSYKLASTYSAVINDGVHPKHRIMRYKEWFVDRLESDWVVLDVGSNTGMMPDVFSKKVKFVYGIEIDEKHVRSAKALRSSNNVEYICADATKYDYTNCGPIDCVTLSNVLEHIEAREKFLLDLSENVNFRNRKRFLIRVPLIERDWVSIYKKEIGVEYRLDSTHFTEYTRDGFINELSNADIKVIDYEIRFGEIFAVCEAES